MSRSDWARLGLIIAALGCVIFIAVQARGHTPEPAPNYATATFRPFPTYRPSPTPIAGLHDYAAPVSPSSAAPAPTVAPTPTPRAPARRRKAPSAAGHTASGSGTRTIRRTNHNLRGKASWHATGRDGYYAAACRPLRQAIGSGWRGRHVIVEYQGRWLGVVLNDWCASKDKTIDLSDEVFRYFAPLSRGVIRVGVGW